MNTSGELNANITIEKETKIVKTENSSDIAQIHINYDSPLKLKCSINSKLPHVEGQWHSCKWTESSPNNVHRQCVTQYSTNSTHSRIGVKSTCKESNDNILLNTTIQKELSVYPTGEHTCILEITKFNHLFRNEWTTWTCTFVECETAECLQMNGCTARANVKVFVSNSNFVDK